MKWLCHLCEPLPCVFDNNIANGEWESKPEYCTITGKKCQWKREHLLALSKEDLKNIKESLRNRLLGKNMYIKETDKYYEKLEDAFKEYLKEHNCETCGKHCNIWGKLLLREEGGHTCNKWTPKPCEHTYASVSVPGMKLIVFECTKCRKEITYRMV